MGEIKALQQQQYRQVLKDQQVTKGFGLQQVVGSPSGGKNSPMPMKMKMKYILL